MTIYEIDIYIRDAEGDVVREKRFTIEAEAGETLEVWVDDRLRYEEEAEGDEGLTK